MSSFGTFNFTGTLNGVPYDFDMTGANQPTYPFPIEVSGESVSNLGIYSNIQFINRYYDYNIYDLLFKQVDSSAQTLIENLFYSKEFVMSIKLGDLNNELNCVRMEKSLKIKTIIQDSDFSFVDIGFKFRTVEDFLTDVDNGGLTDAGGLPANDFRG